MFKKVLVLSASAGAGHVRAAEAVERAIQEMGAAEEVRHVDTLQYTNKLFRHLYSKAYIEMVNKTPEVLGWFYDYLDKPWKNERRRLALDKLNTRPFVKMLRQYQPEITICTHFLPAEIISWLRAKERISTRQAVVVTDFDVHAMWLCHHYEQYFVALDETRVHMEKLGIPAGKLTVSGIPIDPVFAAEKEKRAMRDKHGLRQDLTTILLSAGGFGVGPVEHIVSSLAELRHPAQVIALCGRNEELKSRIETLAHSLPSAGRVLIKPIGFTKVMDEFMSASDILLGKPGGLTTSEALAKGLVFVIVNPIPGQEERNSDHLLEMGVAIRCNNLPALAYKIDRLLEDTARFSAMQASARRLARPHAAQEIVSKLLALRSEWKEEQSPGGAKECSPRREPWE
jgi:processive 1,2-diacylglycerol beta-glucosyltransferase